jgi:hypothetical protein
MTLNDYWKKYGIEHCREMCAYVGTSYEYFKHMCHKRKRPSIDMAWKMVDFSKGELALEELCFREYVVYSKKV